MNEAQRLRSGLTMAAVLGTAVVALPASAQRLSLAERVERLEQQQASGQGGNAVDLVNQNNALQQQVQTLQGRSEERRVGKEC